MSGETVPPPQQRENGGHTPPQRATPFHRRAVFWRQHPAQAGDPYGRYGVTPPPTTSGDMAAIPTAGEPSPHRATPFHRRAVFLSRCSLGGGRQGSGYARRHISRPQIAPLQTTDCPCPHRATPPHRRFCAAISEQHSPSPARRALFGVWQSRGTEIFLKSYILVHRLF